ncbi:unnamed protein product [Zymoseptoria tritici ST99CH_1E4]|uniref:deoxyribose-phosphate aldolase n=1 Tax=Zymoseptoria tritici ST99CH_1E4 TaxID=1276532 RepID=A0A2H1H8H2_ZYMTR|nr:unnamed protein product [Zymoseptoria tritici ST99CH_1E4]
MAPPPTTDAEWSSVISSFEKSLTVDESKKYPAPAPGSQEFNKTIDHTLLKLDATAEQFEKLLEEAKQEKFATVCVRPPEVAKCVSSLKGTGVAVASVIGFHEGTYSLDHKLSETTLSLSSGALELDTVLNYPSLQSASYTSIFTELTALRSAAPSPVKLKLILETSQLERSQIIAASVLAGVAGYDFIKTSTGFNGQGATLENVRLMRACCEKVVEDGLREEKFEKMEVKASGGVRTLKDAVEMLEAGASRLGTSGGVGIVREAREGKGSGEVVDKGAY